MKVSKIRWTDYSGGVLNFASGCTPVSEGCANCYAKAIADRWGRSFEPTWDRAKLSKLATLRFAEYSPKRGAPHRPMAFVCDTGDLFHEDIPDKVIGDFVDVCCARDDVIWQVLTKRPRRMHSLFNRWFEWEPAPENIWLGVSVENQRAAEERVPVLLRVNAALRFVSVEPMLEQIDLERYLVGWHEDVEPRVVGECGGELIVVPQQIQVQDPSLAWVICGGESGPNRRPFDIAWALRLYEQSRDHGVPFFFKQGSNRFPGRDDRLPEGGEVKEWPDWEG